MSKPEKSSTEWETPQALFDELNAEFNFVLDPACTVGNSKCPLRFPTPHRDGLKEDWAAQGVGSAFNHEGSVFLNPPWDRTIGQWVRKAFLESLRGAVVVCVLPCRHSPKWWRQYVLKADEIRYMPKRVKYEYRGKPAENSGFEDTAIVIFRGLQMPFKVEEPE